MFKSHTRVVKLTPRGSFPPGAAVSATVSSVSLLERSSPTQRNAADFCVSILDPGTVANLLIADFFLYVLLPFGPKGVTYAEVDGFW